MRKIQGKKRPEPSFAGERKSSMRGLFREKKKKRERGKGGKSVEIRGEKKKRGRSCEYFPAQKRTFPPLKSATLGPEVGAFRNERFREGRDLTLPPGGKGWCFIIIGLVQGKKKGKGGGFLQSPSCRKRRRGSLPRKKPTHCTVVEKSRKVWEGNK